MLTIQPVPSSYRPHLEWLPLATHGLVVLALTTQLPRKIVASGCTHQHKGLWNISYPPSWDITKLAKSMYPSMHKAVARVLETEDGLRALEELKDILGKKTEEQVWNWLLSQEALTRGLLVSM